MVEAALSLADDHLRVGHAIILFQAARDAAPEIMLRFVDGSILGADGRRSRGRQLFATEPVTELPSKAFRLGPEITAHVREAEVVTLLDGDGATLGTVVWEGIRVPLETGTGARIGGSGTGVRRRPGAPAPFFQTRGGTAPDTPAAAKPEPPPGATALVAANATPPPRRLRRRIALALTPIALALALSLAGAVLAGAIGWRVEPATVAFSGPSGGPFTPMRQTVRVIRSWYAMPFLGGRGAMAGTAPDWLTVQEARTSEGLEIDVAPAGAARAVDTGDHEAHLAFAFPLRSVPDALRVNLRVEPASPTAPEPPASLPQRSPASTINDALCDRLAGNRFDGDGPSGFRDEIFDLPQGDLDAGLAACDPSSARTGSERRFAVQRGRLLAHRALLRLAAGDVAAATADMNAAVALWRHGDELGSAYAANLLGAFHNGTFNRAAHSFVQPDDRAADAFWLRAAQAGNTVAKRNYAAQLLAGKGVAPDPARAVDLLRDAAAKGDLRATGLLGAALFTGAPSGVGLDRAAGWPLVVAAQCVDKTAAALVQREIAAGAKPASERRDCR